MSLSLSVILLNNQHSTKRTQISIAEKLVLSLEKLKINGKWKLYQSGKFPTKVIFLLPRYGIEIDRLRGKTNW